MSMSDERIRIDKDPQRYSSKYEHYKRELNKYKENRCKTAAIRSKINYNSWGKMYCFFPKQRKTKTKQTNYRRIG